MGLARLKAGLLRLALWSGAFLCRLVRAGLARYRTMRHLRHLRARVEVVGRVLESSAVAKRRYVVAGCLVLAFREKSAVLAQIARQSEVHWIVMNNVVC